MLPAWYRVQLPIECQSYRERIPQPATIISHCRNGRGSITCSRSDQQGNAVLREPPGHALSTSFGHQIESTV
jgi:hypothetical protein